MAVNGIVRRSAGKDGDRKVRIIVKRYRLCVLLVVIVGVASGACAAQPSAGTHDVPAFVERLESLRQDSNIPGLSVAVIHDGEIVLAAGMGYADVEEGIPATADTPYNIASVTKPVSAVVALRLVEQGVLELDRPIAEYSDWVDFCEGFSQQPSIFARDLRCEPPDHTLRHLLSHTATGTPGTRFSYNPILYSWGSRPIMAATDTQFSALVEQHVFVPVEMSDSGRKYRDLPLSEHLAERQALPYQIDTDGTATPAPPPPPQGDGAAGGVVSTVLDLAAFDIALDSGTLISPDSRTEMMTPTELANGESAPYGLGFYVQKYEGLSLVWHSGWWEDAYSALYLKVPEQDLTLILLANSEGIWWENPLDKAAVEESRFAQAFLEAFVER